MHTSFQLLITVFIIAAATALTRALPFILFPDNKKAPDMIIYLGKVIPFAAMMLLVIYGVRNVSFEALQNWFPELIAIVFVVALHVWKRNAILSIWVSTVLYMVLVQVMFK